MNSLLDISRQLNKGDCRLIEQCATELIKCGQPMFAAQCFVKSGNFTRQLELCVEARNWDEALSIVEDHSELKSKLYLPYANWLAENDRFEDAQAAFSQAGLQQEAMRVLRQLADSAACESRFDDAAFYNWKLSLQCLDLLLGDCQAGQIQMLEQYCDFQKKADVYYAYAKLMQFLNGELLSKRRSKLYAFNLTLFLVNAIQDDEFESVSKASILYTLGEQAEQLKAYHLLHSIYDRLHFLNLTPEMRQRVELTSLLARPRQKVTVTDDSLVPSTTTCFRCSTENSLLNKSGIACVHCKHPFFYSLSTFEQLPLVEFALQDNISHDQALQFLSIAEQTKAQNREQDQHFGYSDEDGNYIDTIPSVNHDTFTTHRFTAIQFDASKIAQFQLDVDTLRTIALSEVLIVDFKEPFGRRYYKIMQPGVNIKACSTCKKIFDTDDFRRELLYTERCPFCRSAPA